MSFNTFYREQIIERLYDDGTHEELKSEAFREIMRSKDRKDELNDVMLTKLAEDYDLTVAVTQFTDEQKLEAFSAMLEEVAKYLDDETDALAHDEVVCLAEDSE
jgi:molecular chaperone DnaK (HSP70)